MRMHKFCAKCKEFSIHMTCDMPEDRFCQRCGTKLRRIKDVVLEGDSDAK